MNRYHIAMRSLLRETDKGYAYAVSWFWWRYYYRFLRPHFAVAGKPGVRDLEREITIVIPAAEKDIPVLRHCLPAAKKHILQKISAIWIVAPESASIRELAAANDCKFVPEDSILPRPGAELKTRGWVLQQFIKFNAAFQVPTRDYLVLDSDTVLLRPQSFFCDGKSALRYSDQYELLYNRSLELIFGHKRRFPVSFITHHMLFNVALIKELLVLIEQRFNRPWWEAILQEVDQGHPVSFSEFELYGHLVLSKPDWKKRFYLEHWQGSDRHTKNLAELDAVQQMAVGRLNTVSFHWHTQ